MPLAILPTPLEPMDRLAEHLGGPRLLVKRDDCTGLALGGNKARKLELLCAEAEAAGADVLVTVTRWRKPFPARRAYPCQPSVCG